MPWKEVSMISLRQEFVTLASREGRNMSQLCTRFGISRQAGYELLARFKAEGLAGLADRSRRPRSSPKRTKPKVETQIVNLRKRHPAWGARKLRARLQALQQPKLPAVSTVHAVLRRHSLVLPAESAKHQAWQRFEHAEPNDLWQMDFKGHFALTDGRRCHPLTVLDDHSRFSLVLAACGDEQSQTVRERLIVVFRRYGLPRRILMDNGSSWRGGGGDPYSEFTVWLMRLGIGITHGRPGHPQTQGKEERFHRTLKAEVLTRPFHTLLGCQREFNRWRDVYNLERPHEALGLQPPITRYHESPHEYPNKLPAVEYGPEDEVRKVSVEGDISFRGHQLRIGKAFCKLHVALRATTDDRLWSIHFSHSRLGQVELPVAKGLRHGAAIYVRCAHSDRRPVTPP
jgi:transposase InsO family protein